MVGLLRWEFDLGLFDILLETALISTNLALSHRGHLEHAFHVFGYLKVNPKRNILFDPQHPSIDERLFAAQNWYEFYRDDKKAIPTDTPNQRGNVFSTHCFVDAEHAGNRDTRRSWNGVIIFFNKSPIQWYGKLQNTVETRTFSSEFITMKLYIRTRQTLIRH